MISFDDFKKVELTVGKILSAEKVSETDKLLKLSVDFGDNTNYPDFIYEIADPRFDKSDRDESGTNIRMKTTPASEDGSTPFIKGDNNPLAPFIKGDTTTPPVPSLEKEGRHDHPISILPDDMEGRQESKADIPPQRDIRQIISGIALHFPEPQALVGKKCMFVTNIEPRVIKGLQSNGMILALSTEDGKFSLLEPNDSISEGTHAK